MKHRLSNIGAILLLGCLSMLFAEVMSGASQIWFADVWGVFVTYTLYLSHLIFFLWIAIKIHKTSLAQLYFGGVLFSLYESWITKVLWAGYMDSTGPGMSVVLGVAIPEYPILVFLWHPVMSFMLPVLAYEVLTGSALEGHRNALKKSRKKTFAMIVFLLIVSTFVANGNAYNLVSSNISLNGTLLIIFALYRWCSKMDLQEIQFKVRGFILLMVYLVGLYLILGVLIFPDRMPDSMGPYVAIILSYIFPIMLIMNSSQTSNHMIKLGEEFYRIKEVMGFVVILVIGVNLACVYKVISAIILRCFYVLMIPASVALLIYYFIRIRKNKTVYVGKHE